MLRCTLENASLSLTPVFRFVASTGGRREGQDVGSQLGAPAEPAAPATPTPAGGAGGSRHHRDRAPHRAKRSVRLRDL